MEVLIVDDPALIGALAADRIQALYEATPDAVLGVATGSSPMSIYRELAQRVSSGVVDLHQARGFALDEYVGIDAHDPRSYAWFVRNHIEEPLGMRNGAIRTPPGISDDLDRDAEGFDQAIAREGGVDLQILGVGTNGHVGFNEPGSSLASRTRIKALAPQTRADNARFFDRPEDVPILSVTQGLGTISDARELLLVAAGRAKARAIAAIVEGAVSSLWPGSVLQLHRRATVIIDSEAAEQLTLADYYRSTSPVM